MLHTIRAELLGFKDGKVHLRNDKGKEAWIPLQKLSKPDQRYIVHRARVEKARSKISDKAYTNKQHGVEIRFPEGFRVTPRRRLKNFIVEFGNDSSATMELNFMDLTPGLTLKTVMERNKKEAQSSPNTDLTRNVNEVVKAQNLTLEYFEYIRTPDPRSSRKVRVYGGVIGRKLYWVFATANKDAFEEMSPIFDASVETMKIRTADPPGDTASAP